MTDVAFYHLERSSLEQVLPQLLEKTRAAGKRALVCARSEQRVESLVQVLWTYGQGTWLPHGSRKDGRPERQPIWLSETSDNQNGAQFLFLTDGAEAETGGVGTFERCFDLFDGRDARAVEAARGRWRAYKAEGHAVTYWRQSPEGRWQQQG